MLCKMMGKSTKVLLAAYLEFKIKRINIQIVRPLHKYLIIIEMMIKFSFEASRLTFPGNIESPSPPDHLTRAQY